MTKLDKLIKLKILENQNRKNRIEEKLKQQENCGDIEDLFDPLTKTLNANSETWLAHNEHNLALSEQTLRAIDWQNHELDKQNKMIQQAGFQIGENTSKIIETLKGTLKETQDIAPVFVDTKKDKLLHDMEAQSSPQLKLELVDVPTRRYKMNAVNITLEQGAFLVRDNVYEFSEGFTDFLNKSKVTYDDTIEEDENKIKRFLKDIRYDVGKGDKKSARYRTIKHIMGVKDDVLGRGLISNPNSNNQRNCH